MYTLSDDDRRLLQGWFAEPFPARELEDRDGLGGRWSVVRREPDRWLLRSARRAMIWVTMRGEEAVACQLFEGEPARQLDMEYGFRMSPETRDRLVKSLLPGRKAEEALDQLFGKRRVGLAVLDPGVYHVEEEGVFLLQVTPSGEVARLEIISGPDAYELVVAAT